MKKKRNLLKRNSGFLVGCVLAAGASFFTADMVMSDLTDVVWRQTEDATESTADTDLPSETESDRVYETDPFTVTADGNIIKGVETEPETESGTEQPQTETDENGNVISTGETDAEGNPVGGTGDGSAGSGDSSGSSDQSGSSGDGGSSSYDPNIEIYDSGNGDYYYSDSSGSSDWSGSSGDSSGSSDWSGSSGSSDWSGSSGDSSGSSDWSGSSGSSDSSGSSGSSDGSGSSGDSSGSSSGETIWEPEDVILPGISTRYIDESELYNFSAGQLRLIRNEIFALHGRIFTSQDLRDYFSQKSWYVPTYAPEDFDANMFYYLNDYEEANLNVILNYEAALAGY